MIDIRNLHVSVEGKEILHDVNIKLLDGEVHALFGPNGSGKTSLIMTIIGYPQFKVTKGEIIFEGKNLLDLEIDERARLGIGVAQQRPPTIKGVKLRNIIDFYLKNNPEKVDYISKQIEKFEMQNFIDREINADLSGGEIKRSEIFQMVVSSPKFFILDEPDSGIDPEFLGKIGGMLTEILHSEKNKNQIITRSSGLIITHTGDILNYFNADLAHLMMNGTIGCTGNPQEMLEQIQQHGYEYCIKCNRRKKGSCD